MSLRESTRRNWESFFLSCGIPDGDAATYAASFEKNAIAFSQLNQLDHDLLKEVGVQALGHRLLILKSVTDGQTEKATDSGSVGSTVAGTGSSSISTGGDSGSKDGPHHHKNLRSKKKSSAGTGSSGAKPSSSGKSSSKTKSNGKLDKGRKSGKSSSTKSKDPSSSLPSQSETATRDSSGSTARLRKDSDADDFEAGDTRPDFGPFEIHPDEIELFEIVGKGGYADVYRGKCRGEEVAVKILHQKKIPEQTMDAFMKEVETMSTLFHSNIALFLGCCSKPEQLMMVSQFMPGGSVSSLLLNPKKQISIMQSLMMARDTSLGMNWLHSRHPPLLHLDLKPANLLLDQHGTVKVCDFGISKLVESGPARDQGRLRGSLPYMPPERLMQQEYYTAADVYSFGITIWEFFSRTPPYQDLEAQYDSMKNVEDFLKMFIRKISKENVRPSLELLTLPKDRVGDNIRRLLTVCWHNDPNKRPSFAEIINLIDLLIIEVATLDPLAQSFWKYYYLTKGKFRLQASFPKFLNRFEVYFKVGLTVPMKTCMELLLADHGTAFSSSSSSLSISLEKFGHFVNWFGPMDPPADVVERLVELASYTPKSKGKGMGNGVDRHAFFGDISAQDAELALAGQSKGTFLIRVSSKVRRQPFVVSKVNKQGIINHQRINCCPDRRVFFLDVIVNKNVQTVESATGQSLVGFIETIRKPLFLQAACPGSRFASVFSDVESQGYIAI